MKKNDFFDEDFEYELESENSQSRNSTKPKKQDDDWESAAEDSKRSKRRSRWRDIEDKLERRALRKNAHCDYDDYNF